MRRGGQIPKGLGCRLEEQHFCFADKWGSIKQSNCKQTNADVQLTLSQSVEAGGSGV